MVAPLPPGSLGWRGRRARREIAHRAECVWTLSSELARRLTEKFSSVGFPLASSCGKPRPGLAPILSAPGCPHRRGRPNHRPERVATCWRRSPSCPPPPLVGLVAGAFAVFVTALRPTASSPCCRSRCCAVWVVLAGLGSPCSTFFRQCKLVARCCASPASVFFFWSRCKRLRAAPRKVAGQHRNFLQPKLTSFFAVVPPW